MCIVKAILYLMRPSIAPSPRKKQLPLRVSIYKRLLTLLAVYYRRYAAEDIVTIGRDVKIVRNFRDLSFEMELKRMGFDIKPYLEKTQLPVSWRRGRYWKPLMSCFSFSDEIRIMAGNSELLINRTNGLECTGNDNIMVKVSSSADFIMRTDGQVFINMKTTTARTVRKQKEEKRPQQNVCVFAAEKDCSFTSTHKEAEESYSHITVVRGIEIDDDF